MKTMRGNVHITDIEDGMTDGIEVSASEARFSVADLTWAFSEAQLAAHAEAFTEALKVMRELNGTAPAADLGAVINGVITTAQIEAAPHGTVVTDRDGDYWTKQADGTLDLIRSNQFERNGMTLSDLRTDSAYCERIDHVRRYAPFKLVRSGLGQ